MNRNWFLSLLVIVLSAGPMLAHHGTNLYDVTKAVVLKATITKFDWGNPHNLIFFDVTEDNGNVVHWVTSTEPPTVLSERGWTRKSLSPGDRVTVYVYAAKNGEPVGNVYKMVLADGRELTTAGPTPSSARKTSTPGKRTNAP